MQQCGQQASVKESTGTEKLNSCSMHKRFRLQGAMQYTNCRKEISSDDARRRQGWVRLMSPVQIETEPWKFLPGVLLGYASKTTTAVSGDSAPLRKKGKDKTKVRRRGMLYSCLTFCVVQSRRRTCMENRHCSADLGCQGLSTSTNDFDLQYQMAAIPRLNHIFYLDMSSQVWSQAWS